MSAEASDARLAHLRHIAAGLRGGDLFDQLVRIAVIYSHAEIGAARETKLADMDDFVKTAARIRGEDNGVAFSDADLIAIAGAVALDARTALVLMPIEGGRA